MLGIAGCDAQRSTFARQAETARLTDRDFGQALVGLGLYNGLVEVEAHGGERAFGVVAARAVAEEVARRGACGRRRSIDARRARAERGRSIDQKIAAQKLRQI